MANPLLGEASGGWTESSSALRVMHLGIRNANCIVSDDSFTQTNPPVVTTASTISTQVDTTRLGVLSGSVCFSRPDAGNNIVGGNVESLADASLETFIRPLGVFLLTANGNAYENLPGLASGKNTYVSGQGTYGNRLFETQVLDGTSITNFSTGDALPYTPGVDLIASRNGYLMPRSIVDSGGTVRSADDAANAAEVEHGASASTTIGILRVSPDSEFNELVYDQRI